MINWVIVVVIDLIMQLNKTFEYTNMGARLNVLKKKKFLNLASFVDIL